MSEWQPIETAPKDEPVLFLVGQGVVYSGCYGDWNHCFISEPTHWMPQEALEDSAKPQSDAVAQGDQRNAAKQYMTNCCSHIVDGNPLPEQIRCPDCGNHANEQTDLVEALAFSIASIKEERAMREAYEMDQEDLGAPREEELMECHCDGGYIEGYLCCKCGGTGIHKEYLK